MTEDVPSRGSDDQRPVPRAPEPAGPELRASDADRERVAEKLRDALAEGRLDMEEFGQKWSSRVSKEARRRADKNMEKARNKGSLRALAKLTERRDGEVRIASRRTACMETLANIPSRSWVNAAIRMRMAP